MKTLVILLKDTEEAMQKAYEHFQTHLNTFIAHKVHPEMLAHIPVNHHGVLSPISQLANISVVDTSTLSIKPWEKTLVPEIEKAIVKDNKHGFTTRKDGEIVYATRPPLTEESRQKLVKETDSKLEEGKVAIRNIRKRAKEEIKQIKAEDEAKRGENELQKLTDTWIGKMEILQNQKKKALMTI